MGSSQSLAMPMTYLNVAVAEALDEMTAMADQLSTQREFEIIGAVASLLRQSGALEMTVFDATNRIVATSSSETDAGLPRLPNDEARFRISQGDGFVSIEPRPDSEFELIAAVPIPRTGTGAGGCECGGRGIAPWPDPYPQYAGIGSGARTLLHDGCLFRLPDGD